MVCPYCHAPLTFRHDGASCSGTACASSFGRSAAGVLDLRLVKPKTIVRQVTFGAGSRPDAGSWRVLANDSPPQVDWTGIDRPVGLRARMQARLPQARKPHAMVLDVGCGPTASFRKVLSHCGFDYVGIDVAGDAATLLADARALPFRDGSFELVWSNAVLQYVPHPEIALAEIHRVLEPGGAFMGSLGFLEAFDGHNLHPMTWLGAHLRFRDAGFAVEHLGPDDVWTGPVALARALFPGLPGRSANLLGASVDGLSRLYWRLGTLRRRRVGLHDRLVKITGGFEFILRKP
jgi:SAM-dependent methyltransferase